MRIVGPALALLLGTAEAINVPRHQRSAHKRSVPKQATHKYSQHPVNYEPEYFDDAVSPKAFVVSLFEPEMEVWHKHINFSRIITVPGLSPLFPHVFCTHNYDLCNIVTGEGEVNAAATITALLASPKFNLTETYFLVAGIAGINPEYGSLGSAAFARYAVSVALQYEVDPREAPKNWSTGYWSYGTDEPGKPPGNWYGTEVFELNEKLRDRAAFLASNVSLSGSSVNQTKLRNHTNGLYNISSPAREPPKVLKCDSATSDVYYTGNILSNTFANFTRNITNGTSEYCMTAQEDTAVMEAVLRYAMYGLTDYSRWVLLRTGSDYDRPPAKLANDTVGFFLHNNTGGFQLAVENLYRAGNPFIQDVLKNWNSTYRNATVINNSTLTPLGKNGTLAASNYIGDVFGSLGGEPNYGPGSYQKFDYL